VVPADLNDEQRELLRAFDASLGNKNYDKTVKKTGKTHRGFFEKMKEAFKS